METTIKQSLKEIVGADNFTDSLIDVIAYSRDASETTFSIPEKWVWRNE